MQKYTYHSCKPHDGDYMEPDVNGGEFYLASEVDAFRSRLVEAETALLNAMMGNANAVAAYLNKYPDPYSVS